MVLWGRVSSGVLVLGWPSGGLCMWGFGWAAWVVSGLHPFGIGPSTGGPQLVVGVWSFGLLLALWPCVRESLM